MRNFLEQLNDGRSFEAGESLETFKSRMQREEMVYDYVLRVENEKLRIGRGVMSGLPMKAIEDELMDVLGNAPSDKVGWEIICLMADSKPLKDILLANAQEIYMLFPEKHVDFLTIFEEAVFDIFAALVQSGNAFSDLLQDIADYSYVLNGEQHKMLVELVHANLDSIIANVLNNEANGNILNALWLLENHFGVSYNEIYEAVEDDVAYASLYRCESYPECWLYSYYLTKPGYDIFYEKREELKDVYPEAEERIAMTFPYMSAE